MATAIDTPLPAAPARTHLMLGYKASWIPVPDGTDDTHHEFYPDEGIEQWHRRLGFCEKEEL